MYLPEALQAQLYFDQSLLANGQLWRLVSGHWLHADIAHLQWNALAFILLASAIELRSRQLLLYSLLAGTLSVDLLLLSPLSSIQRYCGLSGVLNTLLGVTLYLYWRETRSPIVLLVGLCSILKIVIEINSGQSVFTDISWPPFPLAHLAGLLGTPLALRVWRVVRWTVRSNGTQTIRIKDEYLVTSPRAGSRHARRQEPLC
jgi:rhomboid family GlyGly-CTERM serine protease